jgi:hypothetical protein
MSSHHAFTPGSNGESIARAFQISPEIAARAGELKKHLPSLVRHATSYAKKHPWQTAFVTTLAIKGLSRMLRK